ncbi:predicted protein [Nematostella vectensis]|uniref:Uncharacterized protein n=1 Tax=Nematostella vectensis TaxID=45351 RepID=A7S340_NEMVE|nr:predicted protein [Nematostella vectensis]|eukprot:XP_001633989.1 predicted protein [Nematostella vectensis]
MSAAPLWSSKCAYLTTTGIRYSELSNETQETVVTRYFGIFFLIFQSGQIWGNLISSMVLQQGDAGGESFRENAAEVCGANFCKMPEAVGNATEPLSRPEKKFVYMMLSIYLATGVVAVLLIILLLKKLTGKMSRKKDEETGLNLLIATLKHLKDPRMKLILPITFYSGIEQAFIFGDFTASSPDRQCPLCSLRQTDSAHFADFARQTVPTLKTSPDRQCPLCRLRQTGSAHFADFARQTVPSLQTSPDRQCLLCRLRQTDSAHFADFARQAVPTLQTSPDRQCPVCRLRQTDSAYFADFARQTVPTLQTSPDRQFPLCRLRQTDTKHYADFARQTFSAH